MHTRDYVAFATIIKEEMNSVHHTPYSKATPEVSAHNAGRLLEIERMARRMAEVFRKDNENFNVDQFLAYAGIK